MPHVELALRLSPLDPQRPLWFTFAGLALLHIGDPAAARSWLEKSVAVAPQFVTSLVFLAAAQQLEGHSEEARRTIAAVQRLNPTLSQSPASSNNSLLPNAGVPSGRAFARACTRPDCRINRRSIASFPRKPRRENEKSPAAAYPASIPTRRLRRLPIAEQLPLRRLSRSRPGLAAL